jgi:hypothetical protein
MQSIYTLGFDIQRFDADKQHIIAGMLEMYAEIQKLAKTNISLGGSNSWGELTRKIDEQSKIIDELNKKYQDLQGVIANAERKKRELLKTDQEVLKVMQQEEKQAQQELKTKKEQLNYEQALQREKQRGLKQAEAEAKLAAQITDEYALLSKSLKDAELRYKNLALTQGLEAEASKEALQEALSIRSVLDKLDGNLRNYQRNVGNYKSAFDGLGMSFTQVARELPSLTISAQQFFLAISNNLPMVFDEVKKARLEISALRAQGEETPGLFSRIAKSALSINVAFSIAIALLTAFGGKIADAVASLFGYDNAAEKAAEATMRLQKAQLELIRTQKELNDLYRDPINDTDRLEKQLQIAQSLGRSKGDLLKIEKQIADQRALEASNKFFETGGYATENQLRGELGSAFTDLQSLKEKFAQSDDEDYRKNLQKEIDRYQVRYDLAKQKFDDQEKIVRDYYDALSNQDIKSNEVIKYNREQQLLIETEYAKAAAQEVIDKNERILNDERNFEAERVKALQSSADQRKSIIDAELKKVTENPEYRNADGSFTAEAKTAMNNAAKEKEKINKDLEVSVFNVREEFRKRRLAAELETYKAENEFTAAQYKQISDSDAHSYDERLTAYGEYFRSEQNLLDKDYDFQKSTKIMTNEELIALDADYFRKLKELSVRAKKELSDIMVSSGKELLSDVSRKDANELSKEELRLFRSLNNQKKFIEQKTKADRDFRANQLNNEEFQLKEELRSGKLSEEAAKQHSDRLLEIDTERNKIELEKAQEKEEKKKALKDFYYQMEVISVESFFTLAQKISENYHAKRLAAIDRERKAMEESYSSQIEAIKNLTVSEQEKAAKIAILQAQEQAKKDELARREKDEKIKQAKTEKALNIAKITIEGILAAVHAYATGGPYAAALAAAAAGAALANAIATPIPTYGEGTENHPGGDAIVGEKKVGGGYQPELIEPAGGSPYIVDKPTLIKNFPIGSKVKPLTKDYVMEVAQGAMVRNMSERLAIAEYAELNRSSEKWMKEVRDAVIESSRNTVAAIRRQRTTANVYLDSKFGDHIHKSVRT